METFEAKLARATAHDATQEILGAIGSVVDRGGDSFLYGIHFNYS